MLIFEIRGIGWDLSITYNLTKRTKTENFEKSLKMYNIIVFKTSSYKLTALGNVTHLIVNYAFMRPVGILGLPKKAKTANSKK